MDKCDNGYGLLNDTTLDIWLQIGDVLGHNVDTFHKWNRTTYRITDPVKEWDRALTLLTPTVTLFQNVLADCKILWEGLAYKNYYFGYRGVVPTPGGSHPIQARKKTESYITWGAYDNSSVSWILFGHACRKLGVSEGWTAIYCSGYNLIEHYNLGGADLFWANKGWHEFGRRCDW